jgi:hypothetical protein
VAKGVKRAAAQKAAKTSTAPTTRGNGKIVVPNVEKVRDLVSQFLDGINELDIKHGPLDRLTTLRLRSEDLLRAMSGCQGGMTLP